MSWLHVSLVVGSAVEACSGGGTYVLSMLECAACISQVLLSSWLSVE
jgi:hypothetical protein